MQLSAAAAALLARVHGVGVAELTRDLGACVAQVGAAPDAPRVGLLPLHHLLVAEHAALKLLAERVDISLGTLRRFSLARPRVAPSPALPPPHCCAAALPREAQCNAVTFAWVRAPQNGWG